LPNLRPETKQWRVRFGSTAPVRQCPLKVGFRLESCRNIASMARSAMLCRPVSLEEVGPSRGAFRDPSSCRLRKPRVRYLVADGANSFLGSKMDRCRRRRVRYRTESLKIWSATEPVRGISCLIIGPLQNRLYRLYHGGPGSVGRECPALRVAVSQPDGARVTQPDLSRGPLTTLPNVVLTISAHPARGMQLVISLNVSCWRSTCPTRIGIWTII
jgi:hypothetical protein